MDISVAQHCGLYNVGKNAVPIYHKSKHHLWLDMDLLQTSGCIPAERVEYLLLFNCYIVFFSFFLVCIFFCKMFLQPAGPFRLRTASYYSFINAQQHPHTNQVIWPAHIIPSIKNMRATMKRYQLSKKCINAIFFSQQRKKIKPFFLQMCTHILVHCRMGVSQLHQQKTSSELRLCTKEQREHIKILQTTSFFLCKKWNEE